MNLHSFVLFEEYLNEASSYVTDLRKTVRRCVLTGFILLFSKLPPRLTTEGGGQKINCKQFAHSFLLSTNMNKQNEKAIIDLPTTVRLLA